MTLQSCQFYYMYCSSYSAAGWARWWPPPSRACGSFEQPRKIIFTWRWEYQNGVQQEVGLVPKLYSTTNNKISFLYQSKQRIFFKKVKTHSFSGSARLNSFIPTKFLWNVCIFYGTKKKAFTTHQHDKKKLSTKRFERWITWRSPTKMTWHCSNVVFQISALFHQYNFNFQSFDCLCQQCNINSVTFHVFNSCHTHANRFFFALLWRLMLQLAANVTGRWKIAKISNAHPYFFTLFDSCKKNGTLLFFFFFSLCNPPFETLAVDSSIKLLRRSNCCFWSLCFETNF